MIWFTSDSHYGHHLEALGRPFLDDRMDELMIENWNNRVKPQDTVYFLGDFALHMRFEDMFLIFSRLKGDKIFIKGNHDRRNGVNKLNWGSQHDVLWMHTPDLPSNIPGIWLSHYPHRSWPSSFHGSLHLHGHSHGHMPPYTNSLDVGVDCHNFCPISLEEVLKLVPRGDLRA